MQFWSYLGDSESVIEVAQSVKLPLLSLDGHEELLDPLQRQLVTLHQDADWVGHELAGHLQDLVRQSRGDQAHLSLDLIEAQNGAVHFIVGLVAKSKVDGF